MSTPDKTKLKILVVDDEPLVCDAVKMLLQFDGHEPVTAGNSASALAAFAPGKFDLVMVDFEMPGMKGDQLAAKLREQSPTQPILMLTAHGDMLRSSGRDLKAVDMIVDKPFRLETLREGIRQTVLAKGSGKSA